MLDDDSSLYSAVSRILYLRVTLMETALGNAAKGDLQSQKTMKRIDGGVT